MFVDLDRFKEINDTQGYLVGDAVLRAVGARLTALLQAGEMLARIGGDEFVLIVPGENQALAIKTAERVIDALTDSFSVGGLNMTLGVNIGIALYPGERTTPNEVCADGGLASRESKQTTVGYRFYAPEMSAVLAERREIAQALKLALSAGHLRLHYQPKVDLETGRIVGAEALMRWQSRRAVRSVPDLFIPIAEERGLMLGLGTWALEEACRQLAAWKRAGLHFPGRLAANNWIRTISSRHWPKPSNPTAVRRPIWSWKSRKASWWPMATPPSPH